MNELMTMVFVEQPLALRGLHDRYKPQFVGVPEGKGLCFILFKVFSLILDDISFVIVSTDNFSSISIFGR